MNPLPLALRAARPYGRAALVCVALGVGVDTHTQGQVHTALISGVVTSDTLDGRAVRQAVVTVKGDSGPNRGAITDDLGRFVVPGLPAGRFTLSVAKPGWVTTIYGAKRAWRPPGVAIALAAGQHAMNIAVPIMRGGVMTGRITDEAGRPLMGVSPNLAEARSIGGERRLVAVALPGRPAATTDDRGEYRFYGLPPGEYFVSATVPGLGDGLGRGFRITTPQDVQGARAGALGRSAGSPSADGGRIRSYATTYYPGTVNLNDATAVRIGAAEERAGVDLVVTAVTTARLEGTVTRGDGSTTFDARVMLSPASGERSLAGVAIPVARVGADGRFSFAAVQPGRYVLTARASTSAAAGPAGQALGPAQALLDLWARSEVSVTGQDLDGLSLVLERGATVSGRFAFGDTGTTATSAPSTPRVQVALTSGNATAIERARLTQAGLADGTFSMHGVPPGRYRFTTSVASMADRWTVRSVTVGGRDVTHVEVDIGAGADITDVVVNVTDRISELSGVLLDGLDRPAPEFFVFAFPASRSAWTEDSLRAHAPVRPASDGRFRIAPLAPGTYHVVALTGFEEIDYLDTAFLEQLLPGAVNVSIAEGERKVQDLKLAQQSGDRFVK